MRTKVRDVMRSNSISPAFRERLMLAVTEVNQCRYCSYAHTKMALQSGLTPGEIRKILQHNLQDCPEEEFPAILYAQHWAETDGHPDTEIRNTFEMQYGAVKADKIEIILRAMRMANLIGNSLDYIIFRLSCGLWGN
jgi:AhpD family alkylhydroperoxidase